MVLNSTDLTPHQGESAERFVWWGQWVTVVSSKRVDERNVARDIANQERTPTSPSQVYHSPIASYTWSRYSSRTSDPNTPPLLFVEYKNYPPSATVNAPPERQLSL